MKFKKYIFIFLTLLVISCGGGGSSDEAGAGVDPNLAIDPNADLSTLVVNTFVSQGLNITVDPTSIDFGDTTQGASVKETFTLTNGSSQALTFTIRITSTAGGFNIIDNTVGYAAYKPDVTLEAGASGEFEVKFDAAQMGTRLGVVEITASGVNGEINLPMRGTVTGSDDFKVIDSAYMCSNEDAPELDTMDFLRVASGRSRTLSFKICNTGGSSIQVNGISFTSSTSDVESEAMAVNGFEGFDWEMSQTLNAAYADYYTPSETQSYSAPTYIDYSGDMPDATAAFSALEHSQGTSLDGVVIASGSYVRVDVEFSPTLDAEAPEGELYNPISYVATMRVDTSLGITTADVVGASGGKEPVLEISYALDSSTTPISVDLLSDYTAIGFGTASIFTDWIPEDYNEVILTLTNAGSGSKTLEGWPNIGNAGYFTFVQSDPITYFPIELGTGNSTTLTLQYHPTPSDVATDGYDFGQLTLQHTAGNGPEHGIILYGEQEDAEAVQIYQDISKLHQGSDYYSVTKQKSLCVFKIGDETTKTFTIKNNSSNYTLTSSLSSTALTDPDGSNVGTVTFSSSSVETAPRSESTVTVTYNLNESVDVDTQVTGVLTINNSYGSAEAETGGEAADYSVYYAAQASDTGECTGGNGQPLDGMATFDVGLITMNLFGLPEPTRNHPRSKLLMNVELDATNGVARMVGAPYDPDGAYPIKYMLTAYDHQLTGPYAGCFPHSDNPYRKQDDEGALHIIYNQCEPFTSPDGMIADKGSDACMTDNFFQNYTNADGSITKVYYHEFVKRNADCTIAYYGRVASFSMDVGQSPLDVVDTLPTTGSPEEYDNLLNRFAFDSYIVFNDSYTCADGNTYSGGQTVSGDPDAVRSCWRQMKADKTGINLGHKDECVTFFLQVLPGQYPADYPGEIPDGAPVCDSCTMADKDSWIGFGEYEPTDDDDTQWHLTLRNVNITGFVLHANDFFDNNASMLAVNFYITLTTQAVGGDSDNPDWQDLVAVNARDDFVRNYSDGTDHAIFIDRQTDKARDYFTEDGYNSELQVSLPGSGVGDDVECSDTIKSHCKGNYQITEDGSSIMLAGEPVDFVNHNRFLMVGTSAFKGQGDLNPGFAKSVGGVGKALYFTFLGCLHEGPREDMTDDGACYDSAPDDAEYRQQYYNAGLIPSADEDEPMTQVDYMILDEHRTRFTNWYDYGTADFLSFDGNYYNGTGCFYGM